MRSVIFRALGAAATLAAVFLGPAVDYTPTSGVSASTVPLTQRVRFSGRKDRYSESLLFVAEAAKPEIDIFDAQGRKIHEIHTSAESLATDSYGDLFVAYGAPFVNEYVPPYTGHPIQISVPETQGVYGVAADSITGVLAVISYTLEPPNDPYFISFYRHGSSHPCNVISTEGSPLQSFDGTAAFDAEGTLFFTGSEGENDAFASLAGQCSAKKLELYSFEVPISAGGLMFDQNDNLVIQDFEDGPRLVYTYKHPKGNKFALPIAATSLSPFGGAATGLLTLASDGQHVWAASAHAALLDRYPGIQPTAPSTLIPGLPYPSVAAVVPPLVP